MKRFKILLRVFCTVIIRYTQTFWSPCIMPFYVNTPKATYFGSYTTILRPTLKAETGRLWCIILKKALYIVLCLWRNKPLISLPPGDNPIAVNKYYYYYYYYYYIVQHNPNGSYQKNYVFSLVILLGVLRNSCIL
jgi:hypothetical protein